jgi:hypothetical protein
LVPVKERKEVLKFEEVLLLDNLGINVGRSQRLDLGDEEVPYSLDGLVELVCACGRGNGKQQVP